MQMIIPWTQSDSYELFQLNRNKSHHSSFICNGKRLATPEVSNLKVMAYYIEQRTWWNILWPLKMMNVLVSEAHGIIIGVMLSKTYPIR